MDNKLVFEKSRNGAPGYRFPQPDVPLLDPEKAFPGLLREEPAPLPRLSELEVVRHYTGLSRRNFGVDLGFYPLGSCTMKYNPRINEQVAALPGFTGLHPLQPDTAARGTLKLMYDLLDGLCRLTGMSWGTLSPFAGAQGEFTAMKLFKACFRKRGEAGRRIMLIPDSAHGTNPASAHIAGFDVVELKSNARGLVDPREVERYCNENLAGIMMTNPNTLGLFEEDILEISEMIHKAGGLLYYDGANFNAVMGKVKPGEMGFDCVHLNLHKTFSTPHGGGGPGAGPVLAGPALTDFLPLPVLSGEGGGIFWDYDRPDSIGRVAGFYGNVGVLVRAYAYMIMNGGDGLERVSETAVLNANYLRTLLADRYRIPFGPGCMHEFVASASDLKEKYGISALDIAKGLLDESIHPPTVYFPLIVPEALMIEPPETESRAELEHFALIMTELAEKAASDPDALHKAPVKREVGRADEVRAARMPEVNYFNDLKTEGDIDE